SVHLIGAGSCTVTASQPGDSNYNAAADVPQTFNIANTPPTLGNYANASTNLSGNTTITPSVAPTDTTTINVSTATGFKGTFAANPTTGVVTITDAHPSGTYTVTVEGFGAGGTITQTLQLSVQQGTACVGDSLFT